MLQAVRNGNSGEKKRGTNSISSTTNELLRDEYEEKLAQKTVEINKLKERVKDEEFKYENLTL
jgi:Rod binding domain-containing protein